MLDLFIFHFVTLNPQLLLEGSDISIELIWVLIMYVVVITYFWISRSWIYLYILRYCSAACIYFSFRWGPFVHSLDIVQWDSARRDHPGYPGGVSGSGPVSLVSEL